MDEGPYLIDGQHPVAVPPAPSRPDMPDVTWRWWEAVVVFVIAAILGGLLAAPFVAVFSSHKLDVLSLGLASEIALGGTTIVWLFALHRRGVRAIGLPARSAVEVGAGVIGGLAVYAGGVFVVGTIIASILRALSDERVHAPRQLPTHLEAGQIILAAIVVLVAAPIAEELFFRGFLFRSIRARHGFVYSAVISSICFGAVHLQGGRWQNALLLPLVMCFVGFGLAWVYEWRGNIVANMAAHATFNVIGFIFIVAVLQ